MTFNERNKITHSLDQRRAAVRRLRPRPRAIESAQSPRFTRAPKSDYPVGYLAQLARPFTSRRAPGESVRDGQPSQGGIPAPAR